MKIFGVRRGVLVYKGPDPPGKTEIQAKGLIPAAKMKISGSTPDAVLAAPIAMP